MKSVAEHLYVLLLELLKVRVFVDLEMRWGLESILTIAPLSMLTIEEIIAAKDLEKLFRDVTSGERSSRPNKYAIIKRIRAFAPLSVADLEGSEDKDVLTELERYERWSVLGELRRGKY